MSVDTEQVPGSSPEATSEPPASQPKKKRGRKPGQPVKERKQLPPSMLEMYQPEPEERVKLRRRRVELDEQQLALVETCQGVYNQWVEDGRPTHWADMPVVVWPLDKEYQDEALFMLHKACSLINRKLTLGNIEEFTNEADNRQWVNIPYCVIARPPKKERTENGNTEN